MPTTEERVLQFLSALRGEPSGGFSALQAKKKPNRYDTPVIICEMFSRGNCGNLAVMLAIAFNGKCVEIKDHHFVCEIEGRLYDIDGDVTDEFAPMEKHYVRLEDVPRSGMYSNYSAFLRGPKS